MPCCFWGEGGAVSYMAEAGCLFLRGDNEAGESAALHYMLKNERCILCGKGN